MNFPDANVLLHAVNSSSGEHRRAKAWLDGELRSGRTLGVAWVVLLAFVRVSTRPGIFPAPLLPEESSEVVRGWLERPNVVTVDPGPRHFEVVASLWVGAGGYPNLVNDAHLAAIAIERRGTVITFDRDFARFPGVAWALPGDPGS
jgi:toxin-antitoxin system PIN domain toxin